MTLITWTITILFLLVSFGILYLVIMQIINKKRR